MKIVRITFKAAHQPCIRRQEKANTNEIIKSALTPEGKGLSQWADATAFHRKQIGGLSNINVRKCLSESPKVFPFQPIRSYRQR